MRHLKIETYISILFCVVIMPLILMLAPIEQWLKNNTVFLVCLIVYLYSLYFTYKWARIPHLFKDKKYLRILLLIAAVVLVTHLFTRFPFEYDETITPRDIAYRQYFRTRLIWFFFLIVTSFSLSIGLTVELFKQTVAKKEMENEKNNAELALYKAQINPHFLFNTLNSLYSLIITKSDKTESAFIQFSNILKYMYSHAEKNTISIRQEIDYIHEYVNLQELRFGSHTHVQMDIDIEDDQLQIPSMMLITFIENAYKYGSSTTQDCVIRIHLEEKDQIFLFEMENRIMKTRKEGKGIGLENCRHRLEALYPQKFTLETGEQEGGLYQTKLKINLK